MPATDLRERLDRAIDLLDDVQRQRLLDWAGAMNRLVENARAPGASIGPLAEFLHIIQGESGGGRSVYRLTVAPEMLNPHGVLHGGAVYTMVDYGMGSATMAVLAEDQICATIEIKINYLSAVRGGTLVAETTITKQGRAVVFLESRVTDSSGALVATASGSFAVIARRDAPGRRDAKE